MRTTRSRESLWVCLRPRRRSYKKVLKLVKKKKNKKIPLKNVLPGIPQFYLATFAGHGSVYNVTPINGRKRETDNVRENNPRRGTTKTTNAINRKQKQNVGQTSGDGSNLNDGLY